jgi:hypothetical protein
MENGIDDIIDKKKTKTLRFQNEDMEDEMINAQRSSCGKGGL